MLKNTRFRKGSIFRKKGHIFEAKKEAFLDPKKGVKNGPKKGCFWPPFWPPKKGGPGGGQKWPFFGGPPKNRFNRGCLGKRGSKKGQKWPFLGVFPQENPPSPLKTRFLAKFKRGCLGAFFGTPPNPQKRGLGGGGGVKIPPFLGVFLTPFFGSKNEAKKGSIFWSKNDQKMRCQK